ncbi:receptor kinase-like protein Xa21, partial [Tanacetum coccineum]
IQGNIPRELGRLSRLRILYLDDNRFNGSIPTNLSSCSNLEVLWLDNNKLVGSIPRDLEIHYNKLKGGIPPFLGNLTSLEVFSAAGNPFGGAIPDTLGHLKNLREFHSGNCELYGTIPYSIYNLSLLTDFTLPENQLTGSLPLAIGVMLPHLVFLQFRDNQLTGVIPPSISNCSKLTNIEMNDNKFSGKLGIDFAKLRDIYGINLHNNLFGGGVKFIDSLRNCSKLQVLSLGGCKFEGVLPISIGNLSNELKFLDLERNQFYGNLPSSIGNLVGLTYLLSDSNLFTGKIPSDIGKLQKLQLVYLCRNQLSGPIPDNIGNLSLLIVLDLSSNRLEGHNPSSLGNYLSQNNLSGSLSSKVGDLNMLSYLDLSNNKLSGDIPFRIGRCTSLSILSLKGNLFQGIIPPSFSSLRGLVKIDLSRNNLSGHIPRFLELFSLEYVNLSFNNFEGEVPMKRVFANASAFSVLGNSRLCGGLVEVGLPKCKERKTHKKRFLVFVIVFPIASLVFIVLCIVYAFRKKNNYAQPSSEKERFSKVTYNQLLKATDGFSEANLIGRGGFSSVYKGIIDDDARFVAVKVLHLQNRGAHKSFISECEAWRNIRHRNLLKIITSCSSVDFQGNDFKALVYEYMSNGSLHDWLHSRSTTVVHGDLKPSNILLDDDMVAHVGDFGLARFLGADSYQNSSTGIRGTIGYMSPEYGLGGDMTSSGDVYSFGILLLEVMTGKKPTDDMFNEDLTLHKFASVALLDHVNDGIDYMLANVFQEDATAMQQTVARSQIIQEVIVSTVKIGVSCSEGSPQQRMNMENVVRELQHILDMLQNI